MVKQRKHYQVKPIYYYRFQKYFLSKIIYKSLQSNHKQLSLIRLSFVQKQVKNKSDKVFFITQAKLACPINYSTSVPRKALLLSRFSFIKYLDSLTLGILLK